ncbi:hypothetical protein CR513_62073, partial [Mucuna pruriens]
MKEWYELFLIFTFLLKTNLNLGKELKFLEVTMSNNIFHIILCLFFLLKDDTILTTGFLINCMPSTFVDHKFLILFYFLENHCFLFLVVYYLLYMNNLFMKMFIMNHILLISHINTGNTLLIHHEMKN